MKPGEMGVNVDPASVPVEMFKAALFEVGYGHVAVKPHPSALDGKPAIRCGRGVPEDVVARAGALVALRLYGPDRAVKCWRHTRVGVECARVTVAEVLMDPYVECGS